MMFKQLTGIFILLSFLLVKSSPLFAMDQHQQNMTLNCAAEPLDADTADADKEGKQLETIDEDFIQECISIPGFVMLSSQLIIFNVGHLSTPYISLPYPPPNGKLA